MKRHICSLGTSSLGVCLLAMLWGVAEAQPPAPAPKVTIHQGDRIRTGETRSHGGKQQAGEGTFGESRTEGSMAPRRTEPLPTGQPPR